MDNEQTKVEPKQPVDKWFHLAATSLGGEDDRFSDDPEFRKDLKWDREVGR